MTIDEIIEKYSQNPNNVALDFDREKRLSRHPDNYKGLMVVTVEDLDQLRPYIKTPLDIAKIELANATLESYSIDQDKLRNEKYYSIKERNAITKIKEQEQL